MELRGPVREHRRGLELLHLAVDHRDELVALQVLDAPRRVGHQHAQLAAQDMCRLFRLGHPLLVVARQRDHDHHDAGAAAPQGRDRAAHRQLDVVGVRADREHGLPAVALGELHSLRIALHGRAL